MQDLIDRGEASPDAEYASVYGMLEHVLCADSKESDFAIHRVLATLDKRLMKTSVLKFCWWVNHRVRVRNPSERWLKERSVIST